MESKEFYTSLASLPKSYNFGVEQNTIVGSTTRGKGRGLTFNPVTVLAFRETGEVFGTNKRETLKAGKALGLTREFTTHVYNATTSVSNRGNAQVVRGKIRSALGV
tara:strand:+ start:1717 stop:2034 length:318 start_codon:yes stop_codon:yes gene_type:complete